MVGQTVSHSAGARGGPGAVRAVVVGVVDEVTVAG
jgi:hypothetical protein